MPTPVSPGQAAPALGVNETSVKRWCDMGLLEPMRTTGGHRRIAHAEVVRFARASESPLVRPELVGLPSASTAGPVARERALKEALEALKNDEEKQLVALVAHLFGAGRSAPDICVRVLAPALHELGAAGSTGTSRATRNGAPARSCRPRCTSQATYCRRRRARHRVRSAERSKPIRTCGRVRCARSCCASLAGARRTSGLGCRRSSPRAGRPTQARAPVG